MAGANYALDFYGLFDRNPMSGHRVYANERATKYLFGYRYIPEHFDGILIGSSLIGNWDVTRIHGARVYNASISGGNISEESLVVRNVFARGRVKLAIFCIHPYLTTSHGRKSGYMEPREYWGALGSVPLYREYAAELLVRAGLAAVVADENGVSDYDAAPAFGGKHASFMIASWPGIDEAAVAEYADLVRDARAHGATVVAFVPPVYSQAYAGNEADFRAYVARLRELFKPGEMVVDFNSPRYAKYLNDRRTFYDGEHLTTRAAAFFTDELAAASESRAHVAAHGGRVTAALAGAAGWNGLNADRAPPNREH